MKKENKKEKSLLERAAEDEQKEQQATVESLSVRDRLMRRLKTTVINVKFKDDLGEFIIRCRILAEKEQRRVMKLQRSLSSIKEPEEYDKFMEELFKFIAYPDGVCLEPTLDLAFWQSGKYGVNDLFKILSSSIEGSTEQLRAARSFRKE